MLLSSPTAVMTSPLSPPSLAKAGNKQSWSGLKGSSKALAISMAARQDQPLLIITEDTSSAVRLTKEVNFFLNNVDANDTSNDSQSFIPVLHFPDWETLPYDNFSPHDDIVSGRLQSLYKLLHLHKGVIIAPISTLMTRISPASHLQKYSLVLNKDDAFNTQLMRSQLEKSGYRCVDTVYEHG